MVIRKFLLSIAVLGVASMASALTSVLTLRSSAIQKGKTIPLEQVFNGSGCTGQNISPDLEWSGAPKNTKSFAITVFDPDAPTGSGWWHWIVFNIPANVNRLARGAGSGKAQLPEGAIQSRNDYGQIGYGGPCPPPGKPHRYIFTVYALKDKLPLDAQASGAMVGFQLNHLKLAVGRLQARFGR